MNQAATPDIFVQNGLPLTDLLKMKGKGPNGVKQRDYNGLKNVSKPLTDSKPVHL